ncbi:MAG: hypothetical protein Q9160_005479 [Pyrenula sp. 1 TL-2023]
MTSRIQAILLIGGTSGLGEALARRFHALGKTVIVTGRRADRLSALRASLPGLETHEWDISDFTTHDRVTSTILAAHPRLDTVLLMSGIQKQFSFLDPSTSTPESIDLEIRTNVTAPALLTRLFLPHLSSLDIPAHLLLVSSGLAYIPMGLYPVYCATKAAIHSLAVAVRQQVSQSPNASNVNVVEIAPPYVDTGLDAEHRGRVVEMTGGEDKAVKPTPLKEYIDHTMGQLEGMDKGTRELGMGFSQMGVDAWRGSLGKAMKGIGIDA